MNHYVREGATGRGTGEDWIDAFTDFGVGAGKADPANLVRGDTYYVASGSYSGVDFTTPVSGAFAIIIRAATLINHGTDVGWRTSYIGQVAFDGAVGLSFQTDHWVFDGRFSIGVNF